MAIPCSLFPCGSKQAVDLACPNLPVDAGVVTYDAATDTFADRFGCEFVQLYQTFPFLKKFYMNFERMWDSSPWTFVVDSHLPTVIAISVGYLLFCFFGPKVMAHYKPFGLRKALAAWNLFLSIFSFIGFTRTMPHLLWRIAGDSYYASVCAPAESSYGHGTAGLWTLLFILSKVPELIDTVFVVLKKKPLIFLHWYHHVTVMVFCWHSYMARSSSGLYFVSMNYGVHALMYYYYFLMAIGQRPRWNKLLTTFQISQMFVGMFVLASVYYYQAVKNVPCDTSRGCFLHGFAIYASYAALFIKFFVEKYLLPSKGARGTKAD